MTVTLMAGQKVGRWTLLERRKGNSRKGIKATWFCRCDCGTENWIGECNLRAGRSTGCRACGVVGWAVQHQRRREQREGARNLVCVWMTPIRQQERATS